MNFKIKDFKPEILKLQVTNHNFKIYKNLLQKQTLKHFKLFYQLVSIYLKLFSFLFFSFFFFFSFNKTFFLATVLQSNELGEAIKIPDFPNDLDSHAILIQHFPNISLRFLLELSYPFPLMPSCDSEQRKLIDTLYQVIFFF